MDPIDLLMSEHRVIERVLDALLVVADAWRHGGDGRPTLARFVQVIREYADRRHHGKEEDLLFEAMIGHGLPREHGPIACMLGEHEAGRALAEALGRRADQPTPWTDEDRTDNLRDAMDFAALLRNHIAKEDRVLYPLARRTLPAATMEALAVACAGRAPAADDPLLALANDLIALGQATVHDLAGVAARVP
ncbi:MAG: hemerythrin domain-containing protein [Myxococcales bacterium]|nr:hemerythrin domain-containing protein [Myxococcales bacterium]